jgi:hypothetical protein
MRSRGRASSQRAWPGGLGRSVLFFTGLAVPSDFVARRLAHGYVGTLVLSSKGTLLRPAAFHRPYAEDEQTPSAMCVIERVVGEAASERGGCPMGRGGRANQGETKRSLDTRAHSSDWVEDDSARGRTGCSHECLRRCWRRLVLSWCSGHLVALVPVKHSVFHEFLAMIEGIAQPSQNMKIGELSVSSSSCKGVLMTVRGVPTTETRFMRPAHVPVMSQPLLARQVPSQVSPISTRMAFSAFINAHLRAGGLPYLYSTSLGPSGRDFPGVGSCGRSHELQKHQGSRPRNTCEPMGGSRLTSAQGSCGDVACVSLRVAATRWRRPQTLAPAPRSALASLNSPLPTTTTS